MATEYETARACEVGVFHSPEDLESAIDELLSSGFDRAELSLLASEDAQGALIGGLAYVGATVAIGAVVMSGAAMGAAIAAAVLAGGTGGLVGSVLARWVGHHHAAHLKDQIENGGLLLWVRAWNHDDEARALQIVTKHAADRVHVHGFCAVPA